MVLFQGPPRQTRGLLNEGKQMVVSKPGTTQMRPKFLHLPHGRVPGISERLCHHTNPPPNIIKFLTPSIGPVKQHQPVRRHTPSLPRVSRVYD